MSKSIETLVEDIYKLFDPNETHVANEDNLNEFTENLKDIFRRRLSEREERTGALRFSALGKPDRQVWFEAKGYDKEEFTSKTYFKFLYGDIIELMLLFLAKEAGHTVEGFQQEVEVDGVKGHIDAIIDGVVVDVKSASPFGFSKFKTNSVVQEDPFGYTHQLAGYADVLTPNESAAWLALNKVDGDVVLATLSSSIIKDYKPAPRIEHLKAVIEQDEPPEKCYSDVEDGKSGNRKLATGCSYCSFKKHCWPNLRGFAYSGGPRYLTTVAKTPDVPEFEV